MEQPAFDRGKRNVFTCRAVNGQQKLVTACRRRSASAKVRSNQAVGITQAGWGIKKLTALAGLPISIDPRSSAKVLTPANDVGVGNMLKLI